MDIAIKEILAIPCKYRAQYIAQSFVGMQTVQIYQKRPDKSCNNYLTGTEAANLVIKHTGIVVTEEIP